MDQQAKLYHTKGYQGTTTKAIPRWKLSTIIPCPLPPAIVSENRYNSAVVQSSDCCTGWADDLRRAAEGCRILPSARCQCLHNVLYSMEGEFSSVFDEKTKKTLCLSVREVMWGMFPITQASNDSEYLLFRIACQGSTPETPDRPLCVRPNTPFGVAYTLLTVAFLCTFTQSESRLPNMVDIYNFSFSR